jgi:hypothetical protein
MPSTEKRAAAFQRARTDLKALLAATNATQAILADEIGLSPQNLSKRLARDKVEIFELIADKFPPAAWVAARLFSTMAGEYLAIWESMAQGKEEKLRKEIEEMQRMIDQARKR